MGFLETLPGFALIVAAIGAMGGGLSLSHRLLNNGKMRRYNKRQYDVLMIERDAKIAGAPNVQQVRLFSRAFCAFFSRGKLANFCV